MWTRRHCQVSCRRPTCSAWRARRPWPWRAPHLDAWCLAPTPPSWWTAHPGQARGRGGGPRDAGALAGRPHEVLTGVALAGRGSEPAVASPRAVWFAPMTSEDIAWYVETGEWHDKAGAYGIQGKFRDSWPGSRGRTRTWSGSRSRWFVALLMRYPEGRGALQVPHHEAQSHQSRSHEPRSCAVVRRAAVHDDGRSHRVPTSTSTK